MSILLKETINGITEGTEIVDIGNNDFTNTNSNDQICPICGAENTVDSKFCKECGEKLLKKEKSAANSIEEITKNSCVKKTDIALQNASPSNAVNAVNNETSDENTLTLTCPFCGTANRSTARYCRECGKKISDLKRESLESRKSTEVSNDNARALTCPFCGTANRSIAKFCRECGRKFEEVEEDSEQDVFLDSVISDLMGGIDEEAMAEAPAAVAMTAAEGPKELLVGEQVIEEAGTMINVDESNVKQDNFLDDIVGDLMGGNSLDEINAEDTELRRK